MSASPHTSQIATRISEVRRRIHNACITAGREPSANKEPSAGKEPSANNEPSANEQPKAVHLLAVSKTKPVADVVAALAAGQKHFGENYLQDALPKIETIGDGPIWHFIGAIQSNKTRPIAEHFDWVHTVGSLKIARRLNDQRPVDKNPLKVFLQINIDEDPNKSGLKPAELPALIEVFKDFDRLELKGLMTLPSKREGLAAQRQPFAALASLQQTWLPDHHDLSMGMSGDLEAAIFEGATWVRIGTDIFGART